MLVAFCGRENKFKAHSYNAKSMIYVYVIRECSTESLRKKEKEEHNS